LITLSILFLISSIELYIFFKVFGSFTEKKAQKTRKMRYQSFFFITGENLQMILFTYPEDEKALGASLVEKIMTTVGIQ